VAQAIAADIPPEQAEVYRELSVIYFPQLGKRTLDVQLHSYTQTGYLISVPIRADCPDSEQRTGLDGWAFQVRTKCI
jgi:hypothetical protein